MATYTVTFDSDGGSTPSPQSKSVTVGSTYGTLPTVSRSGYTFAGWWTSQSGGTEITSSSTVSSSSDHTLYARWDEEAIGTGEWTVTGNNLTDPDGNTYTTVIIGNQEWTVENLRSTKYADGTDIPNVTDNTDWAGLSTPAYCWMNNNSAQGYGALYNWWVVDPANPKQIAPEGWRVPTDADWTALENYLIANGYNWDGSTTGNKIGKAVASSGGEWESWEDVGTVGNDQESNNSTGFSALPGGYRGNLGHFSTVGFDGFWWSATEHDAFDAWARDLFFFDVPLFRFNYGKRLGFSVRLVRDI